MGSGFAPDSFETRDLLFTVDCSFITNLLLQARFYDSVAMTLPSCASTFEQHSQHLLAWDFLPGCVQHSQRRLMVFTRILLETPLGDDALILRVRIHPHRVVGSVRHLPTI